MGVCLGKEKRNETGDSVDRSNGLTNPVQGSLTDLSPPRSAIPSDNETYHNHQHPHIPSFSRGTRVIDKLVIETLSVIRTLVDK